jgi:hypothetical protein
VQHTPPTNGVRTPIQHTVTPSVGNQPTIDHSPNNLMTPNNDVINNRFQVIETELNFQCETKKGLDLRLHHLEHRTTTIDDNTNQMMAFWKITPAQKRKADSELPDSTDGYADQMDTKGNALNPLALHTNGDEGQW